MRILTILTAALAASAAQAHPGHEQADEPAGPEGEGEAGRGEGADDSYSHSVLFDVALTDNLQYVFQSDVLRINNEATGYSEDDLSINQYVFLTLTDTIKLGQRIEWWKDEGVSHYESTSGVNIKLLDNLVFRPEYRVDWAPGTDIDERTFGMDMVLTY